MKRFFAALTYQLRRRAAIRAYRHCADRTTQLFAAYTSAEQDLRAAIAAESDAEKRMEQFITSK